MRLEECEFFNALLLNVETDIRYSAVTREVYFD